MASIDNTDDGKNKILSLQQTFLIALDNFEDNYINYQLNIDNDEYKNIFLKSKSQLQEIMSNLSDLSEEMYNSTSSNHSNNQYEIEIEEPYDVTIDKLNNIGDKNRASNKLVDDYQDMYERQFYKNFQIILGVFVISFLTYKMKNI